MFAGGSQLWLLPRPERPLLSHRLAWAACPQLASRGEAAIREFSVTRGPGRPTGDLRESPHFEGQQIISLQASKRKGVRGEGPSLVESGLCLFIRLAVLPDRVLQHEGRSETRLSGELGGHSIRELLSPLQSLCIACSLTRNRLPPLHIPERWGPRAPRSDVPPWGREGWRQGGAAKISSGTVTRSLPKDRNTNWPGSPHPVCTNRERFSGLRQLETDLFSTI